MFTFYFVLLLLLLLLAVGKFFVKFSFLFSFSSSTSPGWDCIFGTKGLSRTRSLSLYVVSLSPCFVLFWSGPRTLSKLIFTFGEDCQKYKKKQQHTHKLVQRRNFHLCHFFVVACFCCCCCVFVVLLLLFVLNRFALAIRILRLGPQKQFPVKSSSAGIGQWDNNKNCCLFLLPLLQKRDAAAHKHTKRTRTHTRIHGEQQKFLCCLCAFLYFAFALRSSLSLLVQRRTGFCFCTSLCIWLSLFLATTIKSNREN